MNSSERPQVSLSLRQIEVFLRIADLKSFSAASKALHVSQPALTRNIKQAEESLGARLFDRDTRHVELTTLGVQLIPIARRVLGEVSLACDQMNDFVQSVQGKLTIAAMPSVAAALLPQLIAIFAQTYPAIDFRIIELQSANIVNAVADGICDFGISVRPSRNPRVSYKHLIDDGIFLVCKSDDPLAACKSIPWTVFHTRPMIAMVRGCSIRAIAESVFRTLELDFHPHYECQHISTIQNLIEEGLGVSPMSSLMFGQIKLRNVAARQLIRPNVSRPVGILTRVGRSLTPAGQVFIKTAVNEALQIYQRLIK